MTSPAAARGIDPRGPRFSAGITAILFLVVIALALLGYGTAALILDADGAVRARIGGAVRRDVVVAELARVLAA